MIEEKADDKRDTGFWTVVFLSVNCALAGCIFGIPWAFQKVGWAYGLLSAILGLSLHLISSIIMLQTLTRMNKIDEYMKQGFKISPVPILELFKNQPHSYYIKKGDLEENTPLMPSSFSETNFDHDLTSISRVLLGRTVEKIFSAVYITTLIIQLIAFNAAFASCMAAFVPIVTIETCDIYKMPDFDESCRYKYMFYLVVYGMAMAVLCFFVNSLNQTWYLMGIFIVRCVVIFIIALTSITSIIVDTEIDDNDGIDKSVDPFRLRNIGIAAPIIFLSIGFQIVLPNTLSTLTDKQKAPKVITTSILIAFTLVLTIGLTALFSIEHIDQIITIDWKNYSNGENPSKRQWWTFWVAGVVTLFPALDVTSSFPFIIESAAKNMNSLRDDYEQDDKGFVLKAKMAVVGIVVVMPAYFYNVGPLFALNGCINLTISLLFVLMLGVAAKIIVPEKSEFDNFLAGKSVLRWLLVATGAFTVGVWVAYLIFFVSK